MNIIDVPDFASAAASAKTKERNVTDMLEKRNKERQTNLEEKHELHKKNTAENENLDNFQANFKDQVNDIESRIAALKLADRSTLNAEIGAVLTAIQNLQNFLTSGTMFLSNYNIKTFQSAINELKVKLDASKDRLVTKKKFGFRSKTERPAKEETTAQSTKMASQSVVTNQLIDWTVIDKQRQEIVLEGDDVSHKDITISTLTDCIIRIVGYAGSVQLSHLTNCILICGPVERSVFADNCQNCKFVFGCQQFRFHSSTLCDIYMHVTSRAIIEDCSSIQVAPYNYEYPNIQNDFEKAGLDLTKNHWDNVADFNWLSTDSPSPNWRQLDPTEWVSDWNEVLVAFRKHFATA